MDRYLKVYFMIFGVLLLVAVPGYGYDLSGVWNGDDGGKYYIRQIGDTLWWLGSNPPNWANVAKGTIGGDTITLDWADVPMGSIASNGILVLRIDSDNKLTAEKKTGGFGGSNWSR
ncbi:MAG: hypothetical protein LUQ38_11625 [Methanotrichaceae archaeon]|nr:hypothetical protein [Methanotrichaceae archaeon]MDD1757948.1 hypothetical protein [Methanotrichaceae archaeon]